MEKTEIEKAYLKLRKFLIEHNYQGVGFDFRTYDFKEDIPHITYKGERRNVSYVEMRSETTLYVELAPYWHLVAIKFDEIDSEELFQLLSNVFYELTESQEYLDFNEFLSN